MLHFDLFFTHTWVLCELHCASLTKTRALFTKKAIMYNLWDILNSMLNFIY